MHERNAVVVIPRTIVGSADGDDLFVYRSTFCLEPYLLSVLGHLEFDDFSELALTCCGKGTGDKVDKGNKDSIITIRF